MAKLKIGLLSKGSAIVLAAASGFMSHAAWAQTNTADDEIIVTARRVSESLIEVPVAVSAFNEDKIENLGLRSIDDIARHTAGFSFSQAFGRTTERPVIRGAANILAGVQYGVEAGAAYFVDGVYYSGDMQALDTRGLERAEVIKGPQSALYGRNTYSGAINFVTKRPSSEGFSGNLEALAAEDGEYELYGRLSNSFADGKVGASISARYYEYGGDSAWINGAGNGNEQLGAEETFSINAVVDMAPNDNFSMITRFGYTQDEDGPRPFALIGTEANNCFPGYRSGEFYGPSVFPFPTPYGNIFPGNQVTTDSNFQYLCGSLSDFEDISPTQDLDSGPYNGVERDLIFATHKMDYDFDAGYRLSAQFGLRDQMLKTGSDSDHLDGTMRFFAISPFFSIPQADGLFYNGGVSETFDYSAEVRLASPVENRFRWSIGAFYYDFEDEQAGIGFGNPMSNDYIGVFDDILTVTNKAVFATLDFDLTDQLELSLEGRYQEESKGLTTFGNGLGQSATYESEVTYDDFIPKVILSYDINDRMSVYGSYAKGIKPGGVNGPNGIAANAEFYEPEEADAFEIGYKMATADNRGNLTVSAFFNDVQKYQLTTPITNGSAVNSVATNQGDAEIKGIEFEGFYDVTENLTLGGSYAYTDAEFTSGCDDFQFTLNTGGFLIQPFDLDDESTQGFIRNPADPSVGAGLTTPLTDPAGLFTGNLSCSIAGHKIPMTSEHQASVYGSFETPISSEVDFFANVDLTYESSKYVQVHNLLETGGATLLGGNVGITKGGKRLELFARNILNERTPPIATRWFDSFEGFNTITTNPPFGVPAGAGRASIDRSPVGPRSAFLSYRRGTQIGVRASMDF